MKKYLGMLGLLLVTIIWGGGFPASDMALESYTPFEILVIRFFVAAVLMAALSFKQLKTITKTEWKAGMIMGFFLFSGFALQIVGLQYTTASKNAFLTATNVVMVPFIAFVIYRKKVGVQSIIGAALAIIGAGVLSLEKGFSLGLGDMLTLACAVGFACQIFWTGEFADKGRVRVLNFVQMLSAFLLSLIGYVISLATGGASGKIITMRGTGGVLYLALASTALAYLIQTLCQRYVDETKTAIILSMEAVFGSVFSVLLLNERVTTRLLVGSCLILAAVLVSEVKLGAKEESYPEENYPADMVATEIEK